MKILYFVPHLNSVYAQRTIIEGYRNAFVDMGHKFRFLTADDNQAEVVNEYSPDMFFTGISSYIFKFLDMQAVASMKKSGTKVYVNTPFWTSPFSKLRMNETPGLKTIPEYVNLIKSGDYGDVYYSVAEQEDPRMEGFEKTTGYNFVTVPLAADKLVHFPEQSQEFECDISFLGTYLPEKRDFINKNVLPLKDKYKVMLLGQDWSALDRGIGWIGRFGKYFNLPILKDIQKPKLALDDERKIYSSAKISLNIHEKYQREFGMECNERTFKIPACGGFELCDYVSCISRYFDVGKEIVLATDTQDWLEKLHYYIQNSEERKKIISAGRARVLRDHTYHNRVQKFVEIHNSLSK